MTQRDIEQKYSQMRLALKEAYTQQMLVLNREYNNNCQKIIDEEKAVLTGLLAQKKEYIAKCSKSRNCFIYANNEVRNEAESEYAKASFEYKTFLADSELQQKAMRLECVLKKKKLYADYENSCMIHRLAYEKELHAITCEQNAELNTINKNNK